MSKGYGETMALLEFVTKMAQKPDKPKRKKVRINDFDYRDIDVTAFIHREIERAENLKKLLSDYEKANKKEEKKDKKDDGWSANQISTLLVATFPLAVLMCSAALHVLFR